jgi:hypothetical protein
MKFPIGFWKSIREYWSCTMKTALRGLVRSIEQHPTFIAQAIPAVGFAFSAPMRRMKFPLDVGIHP